MTQLCFLWHSLYNKSELKKRPNKALGRYSILTTYFYKGPFKGEFSYFLLQIAGLNAIGISWQYDCDFATRYHWLAIG